MGSSNADAIVLSSDDSDGNSLSFFDSKDEQPAEQPVEEQLQLRGIYCVMYDAADHLCNLCLICFL